MSEDLEALIRQRDALSAQIAAASSDEAEADTCALDVLSEEALKVAAEYGLPVAEGERKNVQTVTIDRWLTVSLGYPRGEYRATLAVSTNGGIDARWDGKLPPPVAFAGYLRGLIKFDLPGMVADAMKESDR